MADAPRTTSSKKPKDSEFYQQKLKAWQPILTPGYVTVTFAVTGILFLILGAILYSASESVVEASTQYDGEGVTEAMAKGCAITSSNVQNNCTVRVTVPAKMVAPVYVYYQLDNFYQNHRRYVKSRSDSQLSGSVLTKDQLTNDCDPMVTAADGRVLSPCGLIANSFFNDVIGTPPEVAGHWDETGIAWQSDRENKFKNPETFDTTKYKYLWETYPGVISDKGAQKGVQNEHFIVWMRTAALPTFRKLYARIDTDIPANTVLHFNVTANFLVSSFSGKKSLVVSTASWLGGKNDFLGLAYLVVGALCLVLGLAFWVRYRLNGRQLGDPKYLTFRR